MRDEVRAVNRHARAVQGASGRLYFSGLRDSSFAREACCVSRLLQTSSQSSKIVGSQIE
jgi:hypothetical protein